MSTIISIEYLREVVSHHDALVKSVRSSNHDMRCWDYLLQQLQDPEHYRPIKPLDAGMVRSKVYDAARDEWRERAVAKDPRGQAKKTHYSKKLSTSLLPPAGNMRVFQHGLGEHVGLVFDIKECKVKPSYVFNTNVNSDAKPWLWRAGLPNHQARALRAAIRTLPDLRQEALAAAAQGAVLEHNEVIAGLSAQAVVGVFIGKDDLLHRMAGLAMQAQVFQALNRTVPVVIMSPGDLLTEYTLSRQQEDLAQARALPAAHPVRQYADLYCSKIRIPEPAAPVLYRDVLVYMNQFFDVAERERLRDLQQRGCFDGAAGFLSNPALFSDSGMLSRKPQVLDAQHVRSALLLVERAAKDEGYYLLHKAEVDRQIDYLAQDSVQCFTFEARALFLKVVSEQQHFSPIVSAFLHKGFHLFLSQQQVAYFATQLVRFATAKQCQFLYESRFAIDTLYINIDIAEDVMRRVGEDASYEKTHRMSLGPLNLLTMAALYNPVIVPALNRQFPQLLLPALAVVNALYKKFKNLKVDSTKRYWTLDSLAVSPISMDMLENAHLALLKILEQRQLPYAYSYQEKRLLERHFIQGIQNTHDLSALVSYHDRLKQSPSLCARRHSTYDAMRAYFFGPRKTSIQRTVEAAVEARRTALQKG